MFAGFVPAPEGRLAHVEHLSGRLDRQQLVALQGTHGQSLDNLDHGDKEKGNRIADLVRPGFEFYRLPFRNDLNMRSARHGEWFKVRALLLWRLASLRRIDSNSRSWPSRVWLASRVSSASG